MRAHWPHRRHRPPPNTRTDADTIQALLTERAELLARVKRAEAQLALAKRFLTLDGLDQYLRATDHLDEWSVDAVSDALP